MNQTILVPLDGSTLAEYGLQSACRIAVETAAPLLLLYAVPFTGTASAEDRSKQRAGLQEARGYLHYTQQSVKQRGLTARVEILPGDPAAAILFAADREDVGLISMATHGRSGLGRAFLGSVAETIVAGATQPIVLTRSVRWSNPLKPQPFKRILVALDGTTFAETAVGYLVRSGLGRTGEVLLLRAIAPEQAPTPGSMLPPEEIARALRLAQEHTEWRRNEAEEYLRAMCVERLGDRNWKVAVPLDDPASGILAATGENGADLIMLATHARHGLDRLVHGSVAHAVLMRAETPVLLLHGAAQT